MPKILVGQKPGVKIIEGPFGHHNSRCTCRVKSVEFLLTSMTFLYLCIYITFVVYFSFPFLKFFCFILSLIIGNTADVGNTAVVKKCFFQVVFCLRAKMRRHFSSMQLVQMKRMLNNDNTNEAD